ncbi:MAG: hypothetical protein N2248_00400 [candidate division WOR-3 bacterium]|nr:hypothetical protein [candidate division WOR-3 bacterium]
MVFKLEKFRQPGSLKEFLSDPKNRAESHQALARFLIAGIYSSQNDTLIPIRPPLYNAAQGFYGQGVTSGYLSAAIAPGDVGGVAGGGGTGAGEPTVYVPPIPGVDFQWMNIYTRRPSDRDGETYEGASTIFTFTEIPLGAQPKLAVIQDTAGFVYNKKYGAAVSIYRVWIEDNKVWTINRVLEEGKKAAWRKQAELAYTALVNAGFDLINTETTWVKALNKAFAYLERKGTLVKGGKVCVVCPPELASTFLEIKKNQASPVLSDRVVTYPDFDIISTPHLAAGANPIVLVPGEGLFWQDRQPLRQDQDRDIFLDADSTTLDFRGNFVILATKGLDPTTGKIESTASYKQAVRIALKS